MATAASRSGGNDAAPAPFSYAQAAKGLSATPGSSASKASSSGAATPARDAQAVSTSAAAVMTWAEDAEAHDQRSEKSASTRESHIQPTSTSGASNELTAAALSSPEMGASTASTVTKDDDVSSVPNTSSDSTWENKSQASTSVEKIAEPGENSPQKGKGKKREQPPAKPLQDAPMPVVNIWQKRAELRQRPGKPAAAPVLANGATRATSSSTKQSKDAEKIISNGSVTSTDIKPRGSEEKAGSVRQEPKLEPDADKARKGTKGRSQEKESKEAPNVVSLPPNRDQESWPTMDAAIDGDRKKAQEKTEKPERERKESSAGKTAGKDKWVKVPFVPSVQFATPMPNSGARRGGRGTTRGGAQNGGRTGLSANAPEKEASTPVATPNGDHPRHGRADAPARDSSPKDKRTASAGSLAHQDKPHVNGEKFEKPVQPTADAQSKGTAPLTEAQNNVSGPNQYNTFPRQYPVGRPAKGRRGDYSGQERRKEGDAVSPTKENGGSNEHGLSAPRTDAPDDADRRTSAYAEGQTPHHSKRGSSDRFSTYNGRERRGGGRGRGGNFSNGNQFPNGHISSAKSSTTYPGSMSPSSFNPEQSPYLPQPNSRFRNGPRSQSVSNESIYRMPAQFGGPQQMPPPINTYMGGNAYDFAMMAPMSAVPFGQYSMDQFALFSMVTTQLEYYFSLENLCKDMFLRKHMDSKGFVFLNVIADFNRIKHLTTDQELIRLVCYQSRAIEFRVGHDGKDRLRARDGWDQWVLPISERDSSAQNEGPDELYHPTIPVPTGFESHINPRYPDQTATSPSASAGYGNEGNYPPMNGFHPGAAQHVPGVSSEHSANGVAAELVNGSAIANGHPIEHSTKA